MLLSAQLEKGADRLPRLLLLCTLGVKSLREVFQCLSALLVALVPGLLLSFLRLCVAFYLKCRMVEITIPHCNKFYAKFCLIKYERFKGKEQILFLTISYASSLNLMSRNLPLAVPLPVLTLVVEPVVLASDFMSAGSGSAPIELTYSTALLLSTCRHEQYNR